MKKQINLIIKDPSFFSLTSKGFTFDFGLVTVETLIDCATDAKDQFCVATRSKSSRSAIDSSSESINLPEKFEIPANKCNLKESFLFVYFIS